MMNIADMVRDFNKGMSITGLANCLVMETAGKLLEMVKHKKDKASAKMMVENQEVLWQQFCKKVHSTKTNEFRDLLARRMPVFAGDTDVRNQTTESGESSTGQHDSNVGELPDEIARRIKTPESENKYS